MAFSSDRHKIFVSFHEEDIRYKENFVRMMGKRIVDRSVDTGNIDDAGLKTTTVRQKIRDEYIRDATVTIVLIGPRTWQRKHVDWEIGSSIRKTKRNSRCGLLGILLPNHPNYGKKRNIHLLPPRLADNCKGEDTYARLYMIGRDHGHLPRSPNGSTTPSCEGARPRPTILGSRSHGTGQQTTGKAG